ncbi:hypothetical protein DK419_04010 [Methylobacterium terrae]|uniref:Uncharacterized protein n=1 Tax=Methylobacterium terrae TaxID=2202827 RepID=A0A2U8WHR6_9HYPH|nr:hypothetical protein [Methylobacterium terrae]AWN45589.1 hypothetical protein DK419_04010 [Methylobacterium terrae]
MDRKGTDKPEPDVAVVDHDDVIEGKVGLYREHGPCETIVVAEQERVHATVHARDTGVWTCRALTGLGDDLVVPSAGLACKVANLYRDTRWQPRRGRGDRP